MTPTARAEVHNPDVGKLVLYRLAHGSQIARFKLRLIRSRATADLLQLPKPATALGVRQYEQGREDHPVREAAA
jgi:hypothetical protein